MSKRYSRWLAAGAIALLASALYLPFLGNPLVFDDLAFFSGAGFAYFATTPLGPGLRNLPYFTLAFPQVMWGTFPPWHHAHLHRVISLAFHVACALALCKLIYELLRMSRADADAAKADRDASVLAFAGAAVFAIHPVAVYGAGYLVQRSILLATLFSLLSLVWYARGVTRDNRADVLVAALFYMLAVFSKEHSLLLPAAAVMMTPLLARGNRPAALRQAAVYVLACLPAGVAAVMLSSGVVGQAYEPNFRLLIDEQAGLPDLDIIGGAWLVSAITQAGVFFKYLAAWYVPDLSGMSVDIRIDFLSTWSPGWIALKLGGFAAFGALGLWLLLRGGRAGLAGFGLLYFWIVFLVEFSTVRFQEPFALYRSYLWAPGILILLVAALSAVPQRAVLALFLVASPVLLYQAQDRLQTFSSTLDLWVDAASKLPSEPVPWGWRPLTNLAREQTHVGQIDGAIQTIDRCISQYPKASRCHFARGAIHNYLGDYAQALPDLDRSIAMNPEFAPAYYQRAVALEKLGQIDLAKAAFLQSSRRGYFGANRAPPKSN